MKKLISVDLISAARKSSSVPKEYTDDGLSLAVNRYEKFLNLAIQHRGKGLVPTRDIDMMWHLHMLHPLHYYQDCMEIFGEILDHDGGFGAVPEEEEELKRVSALTAELWKTEYQEEYMRPGKLDSTLGGSNPSRCTESCSLKCR